MKTRGLLFASILLAMAMAGFAWLTADHLPPGTLLPVHWGPTGEADRFAPALEALLWPAGMVVGLGLLFAAIPAIEPMQEKLEKSAPVLRSAWIAMLVVLAVVQLAIALPAWGVPVPVDLIFVAVGLLLIVIGNVLPKSRPGFFVGIRTPWTLVDEDVWIATHRLGGKLMMLAGAIVVVAALLPLPPAVVMWLVPGVVLFAALVPLAYSWWIWRYGDRRSPTEL